MWLVAGPQGSGRTTALLQVAANLASGSKSSSKENQNLKKQPVLLLCLRDRLEGQAPEHVAEAWDRTRSLSLNSHGEQATHMGSHDQVRQAHGEAHGFPASPDTQTQQCFGTTTCFGAVDVRYVEGGEDLYRTLACFHLSKPYAALMVDDLDLILLRGGEEAKKKSAARERGSAFGATEARLARASALMKNAADSRPPDFTVVCAIEKADGAAPVPYLDTMKRWFDRVVEIGSHGGAGGPASVWAGTPPRDREDEVLSGLRAASSALGFQVNPL